MNDGKTVFGEYRGHPDICRSHDGRYDLVDNRRDAAPAINFWVIDDLVDWTSFADYVPDLTRVPDELRQAVDDWIRQSGNTLQLHGKSMEVLLPVKP